MGIVLRRGVKTERLFFKKKKKNSFCFSHLKKLYMGHLKKVPPHQEEEEEGEQCFPLPDLSAAPQIKRKRRIKKAENSLTFSTAVYTIKCQCAIVQCIKVYDTNIPTSRQKNCKHHNVFPSCSQRNKKREKLFPSTPLLFYFS